MVDAEGGATHNLTITLDYQQTGPVYGYDTYADYIRVYAPAGAQLLGGDGFDSGQALCIPAQPSTSGGGTGGLPASKPPPRTGCAQYYVSFPKNRRFFPDDNYFPGLR